MNEDFIPAQLTHRDIDRLRGYRELLDFYQGQHWEGYARRGEKRLTFNYAKVFIDKVTSYLMSGINFAVEVAQDSEEARAGARRAEVALRQVYEDNNLGQLDLDTEIDCAILGDACFKVTWDAETKRVRVTAPDIQGIYVWWTGDDTSRVWRVASKYNLTSDESEILYGVKPKGKTASMVEVWTARDFELWLDSVPVGKKPNPYGFIPFVIYPNLREPKKFWGISDLAQIMEPQRELNRAMSQLSRILELSGNPIAVLENVEESEDIAVRPGAVWNIPEDAKAYLLNRLQVEGYDSTSEETVIVDSFAWGEIAHSYDRLRQVEDRNADTLSKAEQRGEAYLRQAEIESDSGVIRVPANCGQQLYDVIDITDGRAGLSGEKKRVLGIILVYHPRRGEYEQRLSLGVV